MRFRPCIDIHNGKVKQIVGGTLTDRADSPRENFVSGQNAPYYAGLYKKYGLCGGHIILLNKSGTKEYDADKKQAFAALKEYGELQIGGGITADNAEEFLRAGASHVIVTSYVFSGGKISFERLEKLVKAVGKDRLVLDLSCRKRDGRYYIVTDRWQSFTDTELSAETLKTLAAYCAEFLVHAADAEGKAKGIEEGAAKLIGAHSPVTAVYAGGIGSYGDIEKIANIGGSLDFTVGSALDIFGGSLSFAELAEKYNGSDTP